MRPSAQSKRIETRPTGWHRTTAVMATSKSLEAEIKSQAQQTIAALYDGIVASCMALGVTHDQAETYCAHVLPDVAAGISQARPNWTAADIASLSFDRQGALCVTLTPLVGAIPKTRVDVRGGSVTYGRGYMVDDAINEAAVTTSEPVAEVGG